MIFNKSLVNIIRGLELPLSRAFLRVSLVLSSRKAMISFSGTIKEAPSED